MPVRSTLHFLAVVLAAIVAFAAGPGFAQSFPTKPVRVVVQFPPGGTPDIYGRVMASELARLWGQPVTVENRAGATGTIGTELVAKSAPDGYTLLFAADAPITIVPALVAKLSYDPVRDLAPISIVTQGGFVVLVNPSLPVKNIPELIALVKSQPGKYSFASSGSGGQQHLIFELIKTLAGLDMVHVPYKGFGQSLADVLANQVPMLVGGVTASIELIRSGKLRGIGFTAPTRSPQLPDIAPVADTLPGFDIQAWYGFMAPAGTPPEIIRKIHADVVSIVRTPAILERMKKDAIEPVADTPEQFAQRIRNDLDKWARIVKASGAKLE